MTVVARKVRAALPSSTSGAEPMSAGDLLGLEREFATSSSPQRGAR
ncbi:MAG: hypothetical protein R3F34_19490 [Planctomycetota bacterium]